MLLTGPTPLSCYVWSPHPHTVSPWEAEFRTTAFVTCSSLPQVRARHLSVDSWQEASSPRALRSLGVSQLYFRQIASLSSATACPALRDKMFTAPSYPVLKWCCPSMHRKPLRVAALWILSEKERTVSCHPHPQTQSCPSCPPRLWASTAPCSSLES